MSKDSFRTSLKSVTITQGILFILSFSIGIINARILGPDGVGVYALLILLQSLGIRITDFGFGRSFRYYSANGEINYYRLKRIVLLIGPIVGFFTILLSLLLKYLPINIWNDIDNRVYLLFLPFMFFNIYTLYIRHLLHGQLLIQTVNVSQVIEQVFNILFIAIFVWLFDFGLIGLSFSFSISSLLVFIHIIFQLKKVVPPNNALTQKVNVKQTINKLWGYGQWSYFSSFLEYIYINFPAILLKSTISSFTLIGFFNKAKGLAQMPNRGVVPISTLLFSYNANSSSINASNRTEILCRFSFFFLTLIFTILSFVIKPLIYLLYGKEFLPMAEVFYYLYPYAIFFPQSIFLSTAIAARGLNRATFFIRLRSLPIIIVLGYFLIIYYNIIGAAMSISITFSLLWLQYALKYISITNTKFIDFLFIKKSDLLLMKKGFLKFRKELRKK